MSLRDSTPSDALDRLLSHLAGSADPAVAAWGKAMAEQVDGPPSSTRTIVVQSRERTAKKRAVKMPCR